MWGGGGGLAKVRLPAIFAGALVFLALALLGAVPVQADSPQAPGPWQLPWPTGQKHRINAGYTYGCGTHNGDLAHYGLDFEFKVGEPVSAVAGGTVVTAGATPNDGPGAYIVIDHGSGYTSRYLHLSGWPAYIRVGARVVQGEIIGYAGVTGKTTGPHLHFDMQYVGKPLMPEPLSGISDFGKYGFSAESPSGCGGNANDPSPYWLSVPPDTAAGTPVTVVQIIAGVAERYQVPSWIPLAISYGESGWDPAAVGDEGHSAGLFQNHDQGLGAGYSAEMRRDPWFNTENTMPYIAAAFKQGTAQQLTEFALLEYVWSKALRPAETPDLQQRMLRAYNFIVAGGAAEAGAAAPPASAPEQTYEVEPGDCLSCVTSRIAPEAERANWRKLYILNEPIIGPDPDLIFPGQQLSAPPGWGEGR